MTSMPGVCVHACKSESGTEQRERFFSMFYSFVSVFYMWMLRTIGKNSAVINDW